MDELDDLVVVSPFDVLLDQTVERRGPRRPQVVPYRYPLLLGHDLLHRDFHLLRLVDQEKDLFFEKALQGQRVFLQINFENRLGCFEELLLESDVFG